MDFLFLFSIFSMSSYYLFGIGLLKVLCFIRLGLRSWTTLPEVNVVNRGLSLGKIRFDFCDAISGLS